MCGEHLRFNGIRCLGKGSSPRVRGTRLWWFSCSVLLGIIPACAGNTNRLAVRRPAWRDHPRVCGEHALLMILSTGSAGSSPRVRGTLVPVWCGGFVHRDHPRVCGEHSGEGGEPEPKSGSSPRVRGTLRDGLGSCLHAGIIPACAGNTAYVLSAFSSSRDHPRVCGEHELPELRQAAIRGSSPRVRGTPPAQPIRLLLAGIIPACAGNTP